MGKLRLTPQLIRFAYRFFDIEAHGETAFPDMRLFEYAFVITGLGRNKPGKVLDVGCAARMNYLPAALASMGWEVCGLDRRKWTLRYPGFTFLQGDILDASFSDNVFDAVYAVSTIEHIGLAGRYGTQEYDSEGDLKTVREIARIVRPSGTVIITVPYGPCKLGDRTMGRVYDRGMLKNLFVDFAIQHEEYLFSNNEGILTCVEDKTVLNEATIQRSGTAMFELTPLK